MRPALVSRAVGATSTEPSIPPASRSTSCSRACALSRRPNAGSARRCPIRRILSPCHRLQPARLFGAAISGVEREGIPRRGCRHRPIQYVNNIRGQVHRAIKRRVKAKHDFRELHAARRTIQGYEGMRMIRKGQARRVSGSEVRRQNQWINTLFGVATWTAGTEGNGRRGTTPPYRSNRARSRSRKPPRVFIKRSRAGSAELGVAMSAGAANGLHVQSVDEAPEP